MEVQRMGIDGAWVFTPLRHGDERGSFLELFTARSLEAATGRPLPLAQANLSVSAAGVVRGVHFADVPPGQAKYVTCVAGAVLDVVVDLRVGSPTFGAHETVLLRPQEQRAVFLAEGLGHAFLSLADGSTVVYACSTPYTPGAEHGVHPLDPALGIDWPATDVSGRALRPTLSAKDAAAPTLEQARADGLLPVFEAA